MSHHRDNPNAVQRAFAKRQKELRGETIPDDRQPAICPHCQTRWTYRDGKWNAVIKRHGRHCQCPDNWKCTICKALILNPADFAEYEKNGTHVACMEKELTGTEHFPPCEEWSHGWTNTETGVECSRCGVRRGEIETFEITQEEIDAVPSGDPGQWEISMRELCQEIEKLPASEQQTAISVKASAIYQSLGEFNRYCESFFDAAVSEKLCNFMNTHAFQPGDSEHGWEKQCSVIAPDGLRHCGGYREDHPMSVKAEGK